MFCTAVIKYKYEYKKVLNKKYVISSNCDCMMHVELYGVIIVIFMLYFDCVIAVIVEYLYLYFVLLYLAFH